MSSLRPNDETFGFGGAQDEAAMQDEAKRPVGPLGPSLFVATKNDGDDAAAGTTIFPPPPLSRRITPEVFCQQLDMSGLDELLEDLGDHVPDDFDSKPHPSGFVTPRPEDFTKFATVSAVDPSTARARDEAYATTNELTTNGPPLLPCLSALRPEERRRPQQEPDLRTSKSPVESTNVAREGWDSEAVAACEDLDVLDSFLLRLPPLPDEEMRRLERESTEDLATTSGAAAESPNKTWEGCEDEAAYAVNDPTIFDQPLLPCLPPPPEEIRRIEREPSISFPTVNDAVESPDIFRGDIKKPHDAFNEIRPPSSKKARSGAVNRRLLEPETTGVHRLRGESIVDTPFDDLSIFDQPLLPCLTPLPEEEMRRLWGTNTGSVKATDSTREDWEYAASLFSDDRVNVNRPSVLSDKKKFYDMLNKILPPTTKKGRNGAANNCLDPETMEHRFLTLSLVAALIADNGDDDECLIAAQSEKVEDSNMLRRDRPFADLNDPFQDSAKALLQDEVRPTLLTSALKEQGCRKLAVGAYTSQDVLLGRGGETNHHPGNKEFHKLMKAIFPVYSRLKEEDKELKTRLNNFMKDYIHSQGRRFMINVLAKAKSSETKKKNRLKIWVVADRKDALHKCSQAFRDKKPKKKTSKRPRSN